MVQCLVGVFVSIRISCRFLVPVLIGNMYSIRYVTIKFDPRIPVFEKSTLSYMLSNFLFCTHTCLGAEREKKKTFLPRELVNKLSPNLYNQLQDTACLWIF